MTNDIKNMKTEFRKRQHCGSFGHLVIKVIKTFTLFFGGEPFPAQYNIKIFFIIILTLFIPPFHVCELFKNLNDLNDQMTLMTHGKLLSFPDFG